MKVHVQTDRTIRPEDWRRRHRWGAVPDLLPYGLDRLAEHGFTVEHATPPRTRPGEVAARAARGVGFRWDWAGALQAVRSDADLHLCWHERSGLPTALTAGRTGKPVATGVIWLDDDPGSGAQLALARRALARADAVWALSSAQLGHLSGVLRVDDTRLHRVPFGVDVEFWSAAAEVEEREGDRASVLAVGNDRDRDHQGLLRALGPLCATGLARLTLVTAQPVEVPAALGHRTSGLSHMALRDLYRLADVVCVALKPNLHVSGMTTVLEAQAMGVPVVCSRTPGMADYVVDGVTGILVDIGDEAAMASAVEGLARDPDRAREMGRAGRQFVVDQASTAVQARHLGAILTGLL